MFARPTTDDCESPNEHYRLAVAIGHLRMLSKSIAPIATHLYFKSFPRIRDLVGHRYPRAFDRRFERLFGYRLPSERRFERLFSHIGSGYAFADLGSRIELLLITASTRSKHFQDREAFDPEHGAYEVARNRERNLTAFLASVRDVRLCGDLALMPEDYAAFNLLDHLGLGRIGEECYDWKVSAASISNFGLRVLITCAARIATLSTRVKHFQKGTHGLRGSREDGSFGVGSSSVISFSFVTSKTFSLSAPMPSGPLQ